MPVHLMDRPVERLHQVPVPVRDSMQHIHQMIDGEFLANVKDDGWQMVRIVVKQEIGVAGAQEELQMQLLVKLPCGTTLAPMVQYRDTVFFVKAKIQDMMKPDWIWVA